MTHAIVIHETGDESVLHWEPFDPGAPGPGEALVHHAAIGLNFIDIYHRTGLYPLPSLPGIIGMEGAGVVVAVGDGVTDLTKGDRVAYAGVPPGAYTDARLIPAHRLVRLPDAITMETAAASMLKGMTARYLLFGCYPVGPGDTILVHAAAGGVGSLVCQWAHHLGARVIGTVGSASKATHARKFGCHHPVSYSDANWVAQVRDITEGQGVDVVYDGIGQATFTHSLDCLRPMGTMVSFGQASGSVPPVDLGVLAAKGSLFLTRPSLMAYTERRTDLVAHARDLFDVLASGAVTVPIGQTYSLRDAAEAHRELARRKTTGSSLLVPEETPVGH